MFKAFTFISHVIYFFRKLEKKFRPLLLLSKEDFLEIRCLKSHFFICVRHAYTVKPSCDKIPHKNIGTLLGLLLGIIIERNSG